MQKISNDNTTMDVESTKAAQHNDQSSEILSLTAEIVSAHVANNKVETSELPEIIQEVYETLLNMGITKSGKTPTRTTPAVPIEDSVQDDYIVCLEDGRKLKMLKRHLRSSYNMTPEEYRERWNLPSDYPMVAPNYAKRRSSLAVEIGLGRKPKKKGEAA